MTQHLFDPAPYTVPEWDPTGPCRSCGVATISSEYYWVHNSVWQAAGMTQSGGMLCIGCLEQRLDRRLVPRDFPDMRINQPDPLESPRLRARKVTP